VPDDNSYHVVISSSDVGNAVLDGFTISNAYSSDHSVLSPYVNGYPIKRYDGGGIVCFDSSPSIANCTFRGNMIFGSGGGISNFYYSSPTITDCIFYINSANYAGGAISNHTNSSPVITNCS